MEKRCCDARGCPASYYLTCDAYKELKNCFETKVEIPCCKRQQPCTECYIYKKLKDAED
jgi:hypothetical protein